jgi:hypothetical protein
MAYPASADVFPTILSTTKRNDAGFELDLLLNKGFDAIEALEAGLGIGSSNATPTAGKVRRATGTGTAEWGQVATGDIADNAVTVRPAVTVGSTDPVTTNTAIAALANPTVSITIPSGMTADVYIWASGMVSDATGGAIVAYHVRIDSGTWVTIANAVMTSATRAYLSGFHVFAGITAGAHTIELGNNASASFSITHYGNARRMMALAVAK